MPVTVVFYNNFKLKQMNGNAIDVDTDTIKMALCTSTYAPNIDTHDFFDDITNEIAGGTYSAGGSTLTVTATLDTANDRAVIDVADVVLSAATIAACRYAIIYKVGAGASSSPLICYINFGEDKSVTAGTFTVSFDAVGLFTVT